LVGIEVLLLTDCEAIVYGWDARKAKVGEVPTVRSSDTDADLPTVSADIFHEF
jgi:hypothetical protein